MFKLSLLNDTHKSPYIAIDVQLKDEDKNGISLEFLLEQAKKTIPNFEEFNQKLLTRNSGHYHITVFNVMEVNRMELLASYAENLLKNESIEFKGIGSISEDDKTTYFIVVECPPLEKIITDNSLKTKDFHITIGYTFKDLFKDRKNICNIFNLNK